MSSSDRAKGKAPFLPSPDNPNMNSSAGDGKPSSLNSLRRSPVMASSNGVAEFAAASRRELGFSTQKRFFDTLERSFANLSLLPTPPPLSSSGTPRYPSPLSPSFQPASLLPASNAFPYFPGSSHSSLSVLPDDNSAYNYSNGESSNDYSPHTDSYKEVPAPQVNRYELLNGLINNNNNNSYHFSPAAVTPYRLFPSLWAATMGDNYSSSHDREAILARSGNYAAAKENRHFAGLSVTAVQVGNINGMHWRNKHNYQVQVDEVETNASRCRWPAEVTPYEGRYNSMDEVIGRVLLVAMEADGSRFLRHLLETGSYDNKRTILEEIMHSPLAMMAHPDGHKVFLKLVEVCPQAHVPGLVEAVLGDSDVLFETLVTWEGSQCMVKLLGRSQHEQQGITIASIDLTFRSPRILKLIMNMNGHRVIEKVLEILSYDFTKYVLVLLDQYRLVDLARDKSACCSLQKVLQLAEERDRTPRVLKLIPYTVELSQDPHGNYVVQRLLGINNRGLNDMIVDRLQGNIVLLATQKFSSNVVEACIRMTGHGGRRRIIRELFESPEIVQIMEDPYGNYVIQRALENAEPDLLDYMLRTIKKHRTELESHRYARNISKKVLKLKGTSTNNRCRGNGILHIGNH